MIDKVAILTNVKLITEETNDALVNLMISKAEEFILNYCNIKEVPVELKGTLEDLTMFKLNSIGKDNLKTESLGSYSSSFVEDIPKPIKSQLNRFRELKVW